MTEYSKKHRYAKEIILLFIVLLVYIINFAYSWKDAPNAPNCDISMMHFEDVRGHYFALTSSFRNVFHHFMNSFYAPGFSCFTAFIMLIVGKNCMLVTLLANTVSMGLLLISGYLLGKEIADRETGIIISGIVSLYPLIYITFIGYFLDFILMGMMVVAVFFLIKSDFFHNRKWSVVLAITVGLGMMTKSTFVVFIAGPLLVGFLNVVTALTKKKYRPAVNFLLFIAIVGGIIWPHYFTYKIFYSTYGGFISEVDNLPWYSYANLRIFTAGLWENQLSPPFFVLFIVTIVPFLFKTKFKVKSALLLWILVPNIVLIAMPHHNRVRYLLPLIPALAIISGVGVRKCIRKKIGIVFFVFIIIAGLIQYCDFAYNIGLGLENYKMRHISYYKPDIYHYMRHDNRIMLASKTITNRFKRTLAEKMKDIKEKGEEREMIMVFHPPHEPFESSQLRFVHWDQYLGVYSFFNNIPLGMKQLMWELREIITHLEKIDFILVYSSRISSFTHLRDPEYVELLRSSIAQRHETSLLPENYPLEAQDWVMLQEYVQYVAENFTHKDILFSHNSDGNPEEYIYLLSREQN